MRSGDGVRVNRRGDERRLGHARLTLHGERSAASWSIPRSPAGAARLWRRPPLCEPSPHARARCARLPRAPPRRCGRSLPAAPARPRARAAGAARLRRRPPLCEPPLHARARCVRLPRARRGGAGVLFLLRLCGGELALPALCGFGGVRLFANRLRTLVLDTLGFRAEPGERAGHEDMGRAELFQPRESPPAGALARIRGGRCQRRHAPGARRESATAPGSGRGRPRTRDPRPPPATMSGRRPGGFRTPAGSRRIDENRHEDPAPGRPPRFVPDPGRANRTSRPQDDGALAGAELALDDDIERFSRRDFPIPPDFPSSCREHVRERFAFSRSSWA